MKRKRRNQLAVAGAIAVIFALALVIWVGDPNKGHKSPVAIPTTTTSETPATLPPAPSTSASTSPSGSGSGSASGSGGSLGSITLPPVSGVQVYGAGTHKVVVTVTSNSTLAAVGYAFRNGKTSGKPTAQPAHFSITEEVEGSAPLAIVGAQVAYYGTEATCTITVDGTLRDTETVHGAYHVVVCIA